MAWYNNFAVKFESGMAITEIVAQGGLVEEQLINTSLITVN